MSKGACSFGACPLFVLKQDWLHSKNNAYPKLIEGFFLKNFAVCIYFANKRYKNSNIVCQRERSEKNFRGHGKKFAGARKYLHSTTGMY